MNGAGGVYHVDSEQAIAERDVTIRELRETVGIMELKIQKLEQLVRLKDSKIQTLQTRLQASSGPGSAIQSNTASRRK